MEKGSDDVLQKDDTVKQIDDLLGAPFSMEKTIFNTDFPELKLPESRIVIVGKSGAGKSSLINMLANIFEGRSYNDIRAIAISQIVPMLQGNKKINIELKSNINAFSKLQSDPQNGKQCESQTQNASIYSFPSANCTIHLIDTPGVGDTRGFEQDKKNIRAVVEALKASEQFNGLCLVFKATDQRVDPIIKYLVEQYRNIMTNECKNNLIVCFTYVSDPERVDARPALIDAGIMDEETPYFCFENSCLFPAETYNYITDITKRKKTIQREIDSWERNYENAQNMILTVGRMKSIPADSILDLYLKKDLAYTITNEKVLQVKNLAPLQQAITDKQKEIEEALVKIDRAILIPTQKTIKVKKTKKVSKIVKEYCRRYTMCINHGMCHKDCGVSESSAGQGDPSVKKCSIFWYWLFFTQDNCKHCGCHYGYHLHRDWVEQTKFEDESYDDYQIVPGENTEEEKIAQVTLFRQELKKKEKELKDRQDELAAVEKEKKDCLGIIHHLHKEIQNSSLNKTQNNLLAYLEFTRDVETQLFNEGKSTKAEYDLKIATIDKEMATYHQIEKISKEGSGATEEIKQKAMNLLNEARQTFTDKMKTKDYHSQSTNFAQINQYQQKKKSFFQRAGEFLGI